MESRQQIEEVRYSALVCCRCDLCYRRTSVVFGEGPVSARLMIVGEGPGADEDRDGRPFVGRAGELLNRVLLSAGIKRGETWVTNIVRCRPTEMRDGRPHNRPPRPDEIRACEFWMNSELEIAAPDLVVCLGGVAAQSLISRGFRISTGRGCWQVGRKNLPMIATYHPASIFRQRAADRQMMESHMVDDFRAVYARIHGPSDRV